MTLAGSLSVGLENARLFEETGQRAAELAIINNVGQALAEQLELDALIERLGDQLREVFSADLVYVALHDTATDMIDFAYYSENGERGENPSLPLGEGAHVEDPADAGAVAAQSTGGLPGARYPSGRNPGQVVPRGPHHRRHGCHRRDQRAAHRAAGRFSEADTRLLSTIAANVGVAIQNARLYKETGRRASEMAALAELGREIGALLDLEPILGEIGERARELLDADTSAVFLQRDGRFVPVVALGTTAEFILVDTIVPGEGIIGDLAIRGTAEVVNDVLHDERGEYRSRS